MEIKEAEGIVTEYLTGIKETDKPIPLLASFYRALFDVQLDKTGYMMLAKANKLYGRINVFNALAEIAESDGIDTSKLPFGLIIYLCKKYVGIKEDRIYGDIEDGSSVVIERLRMYNTYK